MTTTADPPPAITGSSPDPAPPGGRLRASLTLSDVHGPGHAYFGRYHPRTEGWFVRDPAVLELLSGAQLAVAGDIPMLCGAGVATAPGLALLRQAGLAVPNGLHTYRDIADFEARLAALAGAGLRLVSNNVPPADVLPHDRYAVSAATVAFLNNKANLAAVVPAEAVPERRIATQGALQAFCRSDPPLPVVVKAVTDGQSGAGVDVVICHSRDDLGRAAAYFTPCRAVVIESFIAMRRNICLSYAAQHDGRTAYLGAADQVSDPDGRYRGNWIDLTAPPPAAAVALGRAIAAAGARRGYRGYIGIDVAVAADGRLFAFDLNFRPNGSTTGVLLADAVARAHGTPVMRLRRLLGRGDFAAAIAAARTAVDRGWLVPLCALDPQTAGLAGARPALQGLILGDSRDEVAARERALAEMGLD